MMDAKVAVDNQAGSVVQISFVALYYKSHS